MTVGQKPQHPCLAVSFS